MEENSLTLEQLTIRVKALEKLVIRLMNILLGNDMNEGIENKQ